MPRNHPAPLVIIDDPAAPIPPGWRIVDGFDLDARAWDVTDERLVCRGTIDGDERAAASVLALARGAGLHIEVALTGDARRRYLEDIERVRSSSTATGTTSTALPPEQRELLDLLSSGLTVTAAAQELHRSRRTVNRILADAWSRLGVATTAEAVARWAQLNR